MEQMKSFRFITDAAIPLESAFKLSNKNAGFHHNTLNLQLKAFPEDFKCFPVSQFSFRFGGGWMPSVKG